MSHYSFLSFINDENFLKIVQSTFDIALNAKNKDEKIFIKMLLILF